MYGSKRIWIGNTAREIPLEERVHSDLTHSWMVYVRAEDPEFITKVTFKLHESFLNNVVETTFPFEITEQGWGEFNVGIRIHTKKGTVATSHFLRIHDCTLSERMDEIAFRGTGDVHECTKEEEAEYRNLEKAVEHVLCRLSQL
uniref:Protein AF-9 homolog n=1 Tax=Antonospora locustae TaxID=278021 RepID=Q6E698_ANTLO|nr:putative transcription initiation factor TFIIF small subunit-like protein [Antonospora locustae]